MLALSGCATAPHARHGGEISDIRAADIYYTVRRGDTLWSIARARSIDVDTLASANNIKDGTPLEKGQVLVIPRAAAPAERAGKAERAERTNYAVRDSFVWPLNGTVISCFGSKMDKTRNKGIDIRAPEGRPVRASRSGTVVYCDERMKGFGKTVIIDHPDSYQTVYAYNSEILVKVGDAVRQNDVIARAGKTGRAKESCLHFEIRKNGESRDPFHYLTR